MDRFDELQTFLLVAEQQSIRRAAEQLDRAPSAVSRTHHFCPTGHALSLTF